MTTSASPDADFGVESGIAATFTDWVGLVSNRFVPLTLTSPVAGSFRGSIRTRYFDGTMITDMAANAHTVQRLEQSISDLDPRHLKLSLQIEGVGHVSQDGREAVLHPGDAAIYDTGRPYRLEYETDMRSLVMIFPPSMLGVSAGLIHRLTATRLRGDAGIGRVICSFMQHLAEDLDQLNGIPGARVVRSAFDLITALLSAELIATEDQHDPWKLTVDSIRLYIDTHLGDPSLSLEQIARAHYISVRQLQYILHDENQTATSYIRRRRLERCRLDLEDPSLQNRSILHIAQRWGFLDASHFSKAFRSAYGASPSRHRQLHLDQGKRRTTDV